MTEAAMEDMIMSNKEKVMNEFLATNHALRIIASNEQIQREVAIAPKDAKEVQKTSGGASLLYGSKSKKKVEVVLKHSKLIANQESTGNATAGKSNATQLSQQQVQAVFPTQQQQKFTGFRSNAMLHQAIQFELDRTWITIAGQFMATISISRTLLATEATGTNEEHAKVSETEWATRHQIWGKYWSLVRRRRFRTDQSIEQKHGVQQARTDGSLRESGQYEKIKMRRGGWIVCVDGKSNKREQWGRRIFGKS
ncbi:MAG: hypothetical protein EZS28_036345 [Streblomastix strix]|uniref:Uncharacterized protein n=1 Tax=Streblomastix strix TaxID=222440 RepID=A0A5J4UC86_9EUKA|nr:MAG: hypothetical protein EZS28_036345 [Streblomastix strix]